MLQPLGSLNAHTAIVGDHLNLEDVRLGRGYSGKTGSAIKDPLTRLGYDISNEFYYTYFNRVSTNNNKIIRMIKDRKTGSEHNFHLDIKPIFEQYRRSLVAELKRLPNLKYIIALGDEALYSLTGYWGVRYRRGSVYRWIENPDVLILAMENPRKWIGYHNSYGRYIYGDILALRLGHKDLQKYAAGLFITEPKLILNPTVEQAMDYMSDIRKVKHTAVDIECSRGKFEVDNVNYKNISCYSLGINNNSAISIPVLTADGCPYYTKTDFITITDEFKKLMWDNNVVKVFQNALFDTYILWNDWGINFRNLRDTMIYWAIIYPDFLKGLDTINSVCTNIPYYKDDGKEYINLSKNGEGFWRYNALDSAATIQSFFYLDKLARRNGLIDSIQKQNRLIEPLLYMMKRGYKIDMQKRADVIISSKKELISIMAELKEYTGQTLNPNSPAQLVKYFYGKLGLAPYKNRKTGKPTTDKEALIRLARRGIKEAEILLRHRKLSKLSSTYYNCELDPDHRYRGMFNPVGTKQGRLSSNKTAYDTGGNMQNHPELFKELIVADEGCLLFDLDLSKAENTIVANIAPDQNMIKAFAEGIDMHSLTGSLVSGLSIEEVIRQHKAKIKAPIANKSNTWRYWGKKANHGLNYGQTYKAFAMQNEIPERDSKFIVESYYKAYPGIGYYHRWIQNTLVKQRYLVNLFGRKRIYLGRLDDDTFREAYSFIPQSTVADIINHYGLLTIWDNRYGWASPIQLLNDVHDSITLQLPISIGYTKMAVILTKIKEALEQTLIWKGNTFIIPVEAKAGYCLNRLEGINLNQNIYNLANEIKDKANELLDR